jgi:acetyl esterase/lipase
MTDIDLHPSLDPEVDAVFRALPPDSRWRRTVAAKFGEIGIRREAMLAESMTDTDLRYGGRIEFDEIVIPGPAGAPGIATMVLRPAGETGPLPCIYFLHGSGMVMPGNRTMLGVEHLDWVADLGAVLVSIDYRVAPEDPHPAPVEDCWTGLQWVGKHAADLGIDPGRLILGGVSGGGGLAAATALLNRDRGGVPLTHQVLVCPMLDDREITASSKFEGIVWDSASNRAGWTALLGDKRGGPDVSAYAAPARAADLSHLPPTYLDTGSSEVFRDEIMDYAGRLAQTGTMVELHVWSGAMHGSERMAPYAEVTLAGIAARKSYLRRAVRTG